MSDAYFQGKLYNFMGQDIGPVHSPITGGIGTVIETPVGRVTVDCFHSDTDNKDVVEILIEPTGEKSRRITQPIKTGDTGLSETKLERIRQQATEAF